MYNGIVNVYKERGFTSHDVVAKLRGILKQKKIGHTGTLDPDAVGVLPVCLGSGTKLCDMITDRDKTYEAVMLLGKETDTQDISGTVLHECSVEQMREMVTDEKISSVIQSFVGEYDQLPPMYSAIKINGKKLYELAREGKEVERKTRRVQIHSIEILNMDFPRVTFRVECSKGTYIRTLCHDIGQKLGVYACMENLTRTKAGPFSLEHALTLSEIEQKVKEDTFAGMVIPVDQMFQEYPALQVPEKYEKILRNGNPLAVHMMEGQERKPLKNGDMVRVYDSQGAFAGIYILDDKKGIFRVYKMFQG